MDIKKEIMIIFGILLLLIFMGFIGNIKEIITGEASTIGIITNELRDNEYLFYVSEGYWVEEKFVELLEVMENGEIIINVNDNIASISDKIIINNGLQIKKNAAAENFAVLEIIKVKQTDKIKCVDSDGGYNIIIKGKCVDEYYEMGVEDFCDSNYLKEYSCKYDDFVEKFHCMKDNIKCDKCIEGRCLRNIKAY